MVSTSFVAMALKMGYTKSGQNANPDLNVKVLNKVTKNDLNFKHLRSIYKFFPDI